MKERRTARRKTDTSKKTPSGASIYFLLWSAFSAFALIIVLLLGVMQALVLRKTYEEELARKLAESGSAIRRELDDCKRDTPEGWNVLVRALGERYDVGLYLVDAEGRLIYPLTETENETDGSENSDFTEKIAVLIEKLKKSEFDSVLYEDCDGRYVYGTLMMYNGEPATTGEGTAIYIYAAKSLGLVEGVVSQMVLRTALMAVFVLLLSFAVSSAISGALTKPIAEITEKAKLLARGDYSVDFSGRAYGSEMQALADTLNFARDEISKSDNMQKEVIANVSHDFKTPLTMIKAYASMIQEISGDNPEKRNRHTQVIIDEADRLTSLVNDVLDLSKIRSGIDALHSRVFNLSEYTHGVLEKFDYLKEMQGYRFTEEIEEELYTEADPVKIGEVLYNLIGNAVNYTGEDKQVRVELKKEGENGIRFSVTDTGKGIKAEEISDIWDRYYRSSEAHKRPVKGTGLGLSIVKTILEKHNFRFGVESVVGKGSCFYVYFPSRTAADVADDVSTEGEGLR